MKDEKLREKKPIVVPCIIHLSSLIFHPALGSSLWAVPTLRALCAACAGHGAGCAAIAAAAAFHLIGAAARAAAFEERFCKLAKLHVGLIRLGQATSIRLQFRGHIAQEIEE